jgi:hypothetical protein
MHTLEDIQHASKHQCEGASVIEGDRDRGCDGVRGENACGELGRQLGRRGEDTP